MAIIKTPVVGVSPYDTTATTPIVLRADANGNTVLANPPVAAAVAAAAADTTATNTNSNVYVTDQEALNRLITTNSSGVFAGANVTINLEEQNFTTTNQVTSNTNYPSGNIGEIQYNSGSNSFASNAYFTYADSNIITPGIRTDGYFYSNGSPFTGGGNAAIGNFVFTGDNMTIAHVNSALNIKGNSTGNNENYITINPTNVDIYAFNTYPYSFSELYLDNGNTEAPYAQIIVDGNSTPQQTWTFDHNGDLTIPGNVNLPLVARLNSGGIGTPNSAEFGTEVTNILPSGSITGSQIYMSAGTGEGRIIVNNGGNTLTYYGVENPGFAGTVAMDPGVTSEYAIQVGTNNQIEIGAVVGNITTTEYVTGMGVLNTTANITGLFANANVTVIGAGNTGWAFGADGNLVVPGDSTIKPFSGDLSLDASSGNVYIKSKGHTFNFDVPNGHARFIMPNDGEIVARSNLSITMGDWANTLTGNSWVFSEDGNLTLPTGTPSINYANGSPYGGGGAAGLPLANGTSNINIATANGNVTVTANATTWTFGLDSKITLPNGASLNDTSGDSVAFGQNAGLTSQDQHAVAIGRDAGSLYQGEDSIAIGYQAGYHDQQRGVAIGYQAGIGGTLYRSVSAAQGGSGPVTTYSPSAPPDPSRLYVASTTNILTSQRVFGNNIQANTVVTAVYPGEDRVDISPNYTAAMSSGDLLTFVGVIIGINDASNIVYQMRVTGTDIPDNTFVQSTGCSVVTLSQYPTAPLIDGAGLVFNIGQGAYSIAVGYQAGETFQAAGAVAIGYSAGKQNQSQQAVAVGQFAGYNNQSANAVAVGTNAGEFTQAVNTVAVGYKAGYYQQGKRAVAIGEDAGYNIQGEDAVAMGQKAGQFSQGQLSIAIGNTAGHASQQNQAVAIGYGAGYDTQGVNSIAIGALAGQSAQGNNSIVINATGSAVGSTSGANTFTVKPVRGDITANLVGGGFKAVYYNSSTGEFAFVTD